MDAILIHIRRLLAAGSHEAHSITVADHRTGNSGFQRLGDVIHFVYERKDHQGFQIRENGIDPLQSLASDGLQLLGQRFRDLVRFRMDRLEQRHSFESHQILMSQILLILRQEPRNQIFDVDSVHGRIHFRQVDVQRPRKFRWGGIKVPGLNLRIQKILPVGAHRQQTGSSTSSGTQTIHPAVIINFLNPILILISILILFFAGIELIFILLVLEITPPES